MKQVKDYPKIKNALLLLLLGFGFTILFYIFFAVALAFIMPEAAANDALFTALLNTVSLGLIILIGHNKTGKSLGEVFPLKKPDLAAILLLLVAGIGFSILMSEVDNLFRSIVPIPQFLMKLFLNLVAGKSILASVLLLCIVAPLTEELLFRGLLLGGFLKNYSLKKSILVSSLLFGLFHLNPWQFFSAFFIGILLGWVYYRTGNLLYSILLHAFFNAIPVIILNSGVVIQGYSDMNNLESLQPLWFDLIGVALAAGAFLLFWKLTDNKEKTNRQFEEEASGTEI